MAMLILILIHESCLQQLEFYLLSRSVGVVILAVAMKFH